MEGAIKIQLIQSMIVDWFQPAQYGNHRRNFVSTVMNLRNCGLNSPHRSRVDSLP